jgi:hypothetical protein
MTDIYAPGRRDITVDILRGYFILSMASGHLSTGPVTSLLHVWRWVDGAAGFICLSGFVLALSQRSKWQQGMGRAAQFWILRRAARIWLISVTITLAALSIRLFSDELTFIEDIFHRDRIADALFKIAVLELRVPYLGLLAMYVFFLLAAFPAIGALTRNLDHVVIGLSATLYAIVQIDAFGRTPKTLTTLEEGRFALVAWQFLFFMGLCVGWRWKETFQPLAQRWRRELFWVSTFGIAALLLLAHGYKLPVLRDIHPGDVFTDYFEKYTLSPFVLLYFGLILAFLPNVITVLRKARYPAMALDVVAMFGRHSLGCFVILACLQASTWIILRPDTPHGAKHFAWFPLAILLFALFCIAVERKGRDTAHARSRPTVSDAKALSGTARMPLSH